MNYHSEEPKGGGGEVPEQMYVPGVQIKKLLIKKWPKQTAGN